MTSAWPLVALREIQVRLTDRNFLIGTGATIVLLLAIIGGQALLMGGAPSYKVAVTSEDGARLVSQAQTQLRASDPEGTLAAVEVADATAAEAVVTEGEVDAALLPAADGWELVIDGDADSGLEGPLAETVRLDALTGNAEAAGTTLQELSAGTELASRDISGEDAGARQVAWAAGFAMAFLFYMSAIFFGMAIATSVVEEKQSRIVEILAAAISVKQLLTGKVIGNTVLAFGQMAVLGAASLIALSFTDYAEFLPTVTSGFLWYIPFFILGFLALACVWAAAGAMSSRSEDLQSTTMPLTMGLVVVFIAALSLEGAARVVGSYVPVMSTILMPMRLLEGTAQWWEALLALGLTAAFCALTIWLGSRLYRRSLLQTSGRVSLKAAWAGGE